MAKQYITTQGLRDAHEYGEFAGFDAPNTADIHIDGKWYLVDFSFHRKGRTITIDDVWLCVDTGKQKDGKTLYQAIPADIDSDTAYAQLLREYDDDEIA